MLDLRDPERMTSFTVLSIDHQHVPLELIGRFHGDEQELRASGERLRAAGLVQECMVIATCNRAELVFTAGATTPDVQGLITAWRPGLDAATRAQAVAAARLYTGGAAVHHLLCVASSLESLVIGEREILAQVRDQYERCRSLGLTGDGLRLLMKQLVATAKRVYTETSIASRPVSVVSLAYRQLRDLGVKKDARFLIIGAGKTCADMCRYLRKHGFRDLHIFNRTFSKANALTQEVGGEAYPLDELCAYADGFDVLISGIGRGTPIVDKHLFRQLTGGTAKHRVMVDLAIPHDIVPDCFGQEPVHLVRIEDLNAQAEENRSARQQEIGACLRIVEEGVAEFRALAKERRVERAMSAVPGEVRAMRERTVSEVFADDLATLDPHARAVFDRVLDHMERKYISIPMKLAKELILEETKRSAEAGRP